MESSALLKKNHALTALKIIREKKEISRTELADLMKFSKPKITQITQQLIDHNLIEVHREGSSSSVGGRKPILLSLSSTYHKYVMGVDIGTDNMTIAIGKLNGDFQILVREKTQDRLFPNAIVQQVTRLINQYLEDKFIDISLIECVGVSIGGLVNTKEGKIIYSPNFKWENIDLTNLLSESLGVPVVLENCTKAMALGDPLCENLKDKELALYINHGYGIGSAIIHHNKTLPSFCELGHLNIKQEKEVHCYCGNINCLETSASGWAIEWEAQKTFGKPLSAHDVALLAYQGNEQAINIYKYIGKCLGKAIAASVNVIGPNLIIISGGVSYSHDLYKDSMMSSFNKYGMRFIRDKAHIIFSKSEGDSAIRGCIKIALTNSIFSSELIL